MITASDFRNGKTFEYEGKVMQVVEFQHVKPGKGAAFVRTKMKNVITGAVTETSFNPTAKFEEAFIERKEMEYSYMDDNLYYFMDTETYDMIPLEVIKTEPGVRGDTATNVTKPATLETGAEIKVPLFINEGDRIQVDTRTGEYMSRCK